MRVFLPNKGLITKDLTTSQAKAWGNSQFLYYNTFQCVMQPIVMQPMISQGL
ncbi:hypothetical protein ID0093_10090 [Helicobacter pylori]